MPVCRVLWLDLKGTTAALLREPQALPERLSRFYDLCASVVTTFDTQLGEYRSFNFSDTYALLVYSTERDVPSSALVEVADYLIGKCDPQGMVVRAFITKGVENRSQMEDLRAPIGRGDGRSLHEVLFAVNTAVVAAGVGEYAHLAGTLLVDEEITRALRTQIKETFFVDAEGNGFRREGDLHVDLQSGKTSGVDGPGYVFHRIR
jgi:hypothetical protein